MSVLAVVTTYFPKAEIFENLRAIWAQVDKLLIVDNASDAESKQHIERFLREKQDLEKQNPISDEKTIDGKMVEIVWNEKNKGIASAVNLGIKMALGEKFDWLLSFDQDSLPEAHHVQKMLEVAEKYDKKLAENGKSSDIGALTCTYFFPSVQIWQKTLENNQIPGNPKNPKNPKISQIENLEEKTIENSLEKNSTKIPTKTEKNPEKNPEFVEAKMSMSSGSMLSLRALQAGVSATEKLFVDYFDADIFLQIREKGLKILEIQDICLRHGLASLSHQKFQFFGPRSCILSNQAPIRRYYRWRNMFYYYERWFFFDPKICLSDFKSQITDIAKMLLFEQNRWQKLKKTLLGIWHGIWQIWRNPG